MGNMFDLYPQPDDYVPNNRPRPLKRFHLDIMTGETASHSFEVPFNVEEECAEFEVIYKLGLEQVVIRNSWTLEVITTKHNTSIITCNLTPEETRLFENTCLDARVQIKFYLNNNTIAYSEIYKVTVKNSLELNRKPAPQPQPAEDTNIVYGTGYGWTED